MRQLFALGAILGAFCFLTPIAAAQGVTSAAMSGTVLDETGEPLPGANVVAIHDPTGTTYGASTRTDGRFNFPSVRVGGPYTVTASFVGYETQRKEGIQLSLGQELSVRFELEAQSQELDEVVVTGAADPNSDKTGAATFVEQEKIDALPTISRSTQDFTRLSPQADGLAFGGRNTQFNNFSLDGSIFNNPYGLDSPVPGGQTSAQPVSLDAVEQVQVSIAPFDVRQGGFTGAGVNTVTKSGSNEFEGTVYYFTRNEDFIGDEVGNTTVLQGDLSFFQTGASFGGPIIEDKLFFFVNAEFERRDDPGSNFIASRSGVSGANVSRVEADVMNRISDRLEQVYGYDTGSFGDGYILETQNDKLLAKLDYNISPGNTASLRFNYLNAARDLNANPVAIFQRGPNQNTLPFENAGYTINNDIYSIVGETNLSFGNRYANKTIIGYTAFRDSRDPFSEPFPTLEILQNGIPYTTAGFEPFSINNLLDQDVFQFTNNFNVFAGDHTLTFGLNYEQFWFNNSFNLFYYGLFVVPVEFGGTLFSSPEEFFTYTNPDLETCTPEDFANATPCFRDFNAEVQQAQDTQDFAFDETNVGQGALYVQDEYRPFAGFKLTAGLRVDAPIYFTDIPRNEAIAEVELRNGEQIDTSELPDVRPLFSPRLGVNWDVRDDGATQVRGGTGIFTGRLPFVWIGNQVTNQGIDDPDCTSAGCLGTVNALDDSFRWPQVWKTSLAVDQRLPANLLGTVEFLYGNDINAITIRNANLAEPVTASALDGRPLFAGVQGESALVNPRVSGAYVLDNTNEGYQWSLTGQLRKRFAIGLDATAAYTYTQARDKLTSTEIAQVLFEGNPVATDPNNPDLSFSEFGLKHRIFAAANYTAEYAERFATTVGLFLEAGQGDRFSYIYAGDFNGDGVINNDLMYVPTASELDVSDFQTFTDSDGNLISAQQQVEAFNAYIEQDDYLSEQRGETAERNGALSPWFFTMDLRIAQNFTLQVGETPNTLQVSLDILNLPNLLNSDWGLRQNVISNQILEVVDNDPENPRFRYTGPQETFQNSPELISRWRAQVGLRYIFN